MSFTMLDMLETYSGQDVSDVRDYIQSKSDKASDVIKEAFTKYPVVGKTEAKFIIESEFTDVSSAPITIDTEYVRENLASLLESVDLLSEGEIKIIINNDVYKGGSRQHEIAVEYEGTENAPKKRGRPPKTAPTTIDPTADPHAQITPHNEPISESAQDLVVGRYVRIGNTWFIIDSVDGNVIWVRTDDLGNNGKLNYHKFLTDEVDEITSTKPDAPAPKVDTEIAEESVAITEGLSWDSIEDTLKDDPEWTRIESKANDEDEDDDDTDGMIEDEDAPNPDKEYDDLNQEEFENVHDLDKWVASNAGEYVIIADGPIDFDLYDGCQSDEEYVDKGGKYFIQYKKEEDIADKSTLKEGRDDDREMEYTLQNGYEVIVKYNVDDYGLDDDGIPEYHIDITSVVYDYDGVEAECTKKDYDGMISAAIQNYEDGIENTQTAYRIDREEERRSARSDWMYESKLPPGFTDSDVSDAKLANAMMNGDELPEDDDEYLDEAIDDANVTDLSDEEVDTMAKAAIYWQNLSYRERTKLKKKLDAMDETDITDPIEKDIKHILIGNKSSNLKKMMHPGNYRDEVLNTDTGRFKRSGKQISLDAFRQRITQRPTKLIGQNSKLQQSGGKGSNQVFYDSTLPSYQGLFVDEETGKFKIVRTCPSAGMCTNWCYASKGNFVQYFGPSLNAARTVNFLMNDPDGFKNQLISELKEVELKSKGKEVVFRWHDSGDFLSPTYLELAFEVAEATPTVQHYAYTKQLPMVREKKSKAPDNFEFVYSFGGDHDATIDPTKEKHSRATPVPHKYHTGSMHELKPEYIGTFKGDVAKKYNLDLTTVITYDELMKKPVGSTRKWNVLVGKGNGDEAAQRKDVLGVYLLLH